MATGHRMKGEKKRTYFHRITIHALKKIVYSNWTPLKKVYKKKKKKVTFRYVKIHLKNCMLDDTWHKNKDGRELV